MPPLLLRTDGFPDLCGSILDGLGDTRNGSCVVHEDRSFTGEYIVRVEVIDGEVVGCCSEGEPALDLFEDGGSATRS